MIAVRVECDVTGCGRHFEAPGDIDLMPRAHASRHPGQFHVVFASPYVTLPTGWAAVTPAEGTPGVRLLCADHADDVAAGEGYAHG